MDTVLERTPVGESFSKAAATYDRWAGPQRRIAGELAAMLPGYPGIASVLELGCGTGILTEILAGLYANASITAIDLAPGMIEHCRSRWPGGEVARFEVADGATCRSDGGADLVASSSALQWFSDRAGALGNVSRSLTQGGRFAMAVPVRGAFREFAESYTAATGDSPPGPELWSNDAWLDAMAAAGLPPEDHRVDEFRAEYADPWDILRAFKGIGAAPGGRVPMSRASLRMLADHCERNFACEGGVYMTYRILYAVSEPLP